VLKELIKVANSLDAKGFHEEANALDEIIRQAEVSSELKSETGSLIYNLKGEDYSSSAEEADMKDADGNEYVISHEKIDATPDGKHHAEQEVMLGMGPGVNAAWKSGVSAVKTTDSGLKYYDLTKYPPTEVSGQQFAAYRD
jgi:hypothetical protein